MNEMIKTLAAVYLIVMSLVGFAAMGIDKHKAIKKGWRISERTLLLIAFIGGGIGSLLGMYAFHHKTKHMKFVVLLPVAAILVLLAVIWLYQYI